MWRIGLVIGYLFNFFIETFQLLNLLIAQLSFNLVPCIFAVGRHLEPHLLALPHFLSGLEKHSCLFGRKVAEGAHEIDVAGLQVEIV